MSDLRKVLYVVGSRDVAGVGRAALSSAEALARAGGLRPLVCGPRGELANFAAAEGLPVSALAPVPASWRRDETLEGAIGDADLVHAVGLDAVRLLRSAGEPKNVPLVVSVDAVDSRRAFSRWRGSPSSVIRGCRTMRWLVPGRTATSRLVQSGVVRGDQVVTLPLLPFAQELHEDWAAARASARQRLGIAPGVQVVLGIGPARLASLYRGRSSRPDGASAATVVWIDTGNATRQRTPHGGGLIVGPAEGRRLLPAMDLLLAGGTQLAARHPAVDALWAGIPIVSTSLDVAAETVRHSVNGYVCAPAEITPAVDAALDMAASKTLVHEAAEHRRADPAGEAVTATARCYSSILGHPLVRPVLIGRQSAR
jgi:hypothetical protein